MVIFHSELYKRFLSDGGTYTYYLPYESSWGLMITGTGDWDQPAWVHEVNRPDVGKPQRFVQADFL